MASPGALGRAFRAGGLAAALSTVGSSAPLDCGKLKVSVRPAPEGYAAQCLGGAKPAPRSTSPAAPAAPAGGDIAFYVNLRSGGIYSQSFLSAPFPTLLFTNRGPQTAPIFAIDWDAVIDQIFGIDNASRNLGTINQANGVFTPTVPVTGVTGDTITGMSIDPTTGTYYISVTDGSPVTSASLYTLNTTSGAATLVGPIVPTGGPPAIVDIAISNEGDLYGHDVGGDRILRIDKATAAVEEIGATGFDANFAQGMDFDASTNTLYLSLFEATGVQNLATVDLRTGTANIVTTTAQPVELEMSIHNVRPAMQAVPLDIVLDPAGNQVLEIGEVTTANPIWQNLGTNSIPAGTGVATLFGGPAGPTYNLIDNNADYPEMTAGGMVTTSDGYTISIDAATRPAQHFDAGINEVLPQAGVLKSWNVHVGGSFSDVPPTNLFYRFIERLLHRGITAGCGPDSFCPDLPVTREQMAVFMVRAKYSNLIPSACSPPNIFNDVPETSPFCAWIEDLSRRQVVAGCGGGNYCPDSPVTREQMSVFILRTRFGQDFVPPACGTPFFSDVDPASPFCRYIEEMRRLNYTGGCDTNPPRYCPTVPLTRGQMAVFLIQAFDPPSLF
jgi:hypothetical protein